MELFENLTHLALIEAITKHKGKFIITVTTYDDYVRVMVWMLTDPFLKDKVRPRTDFSSFRDRKGISLLNKVSDYEFEAISKKIRAKGFDI